MMNRRSVLRCAVAGLAAVVVVAGSVLADELIGRVTSVDADAKKIVVTEKQTKKEVNVTINDDTKILLPNGKTPKKFDLSKLEKRAVIVTHEDGVASKIEIQKGAAKKKDSPKKKDAAE